MGKTFVYIKRRTIAHYFKRWKVTEAGSAFFPWFVYQNFPAECEYGKDVGFARGRFLLLEGLSPQKLIFDSVPVYQETQKIFMNSNKCFDN